MRSVRFVVFLFFILLGFGLGFGYYFFNRPQVRADELRSLATWGLADYLAGAYPNAKVLILANPFSTRPYMDPPVVDQEKAGIQGLRDGFKNKMAAIDVAYPELVSDAYASPQSLIPDGSVTTPLSFLFAPDALDRLREKYPDHELWVSLIGLPVGIAGKKIWQEVGGPQFALLLPDLRVVGGVEEIKTSVRNGKLAAFVLTRQGQLFDTEHMGPNLAEEFSKRYILVSAENLDEILTENPELWQVY